MAGREGLPLYVEDHPDEVAAMLSAIRLACNHLNIPASRIDAFPGLEDFLIEVNTALNILNDAVPQES